MDELRPYSPARLRRAATRAIMRLGPMQFAVQGNVEPIYYVDLSQDPPCQCRDTEHRGGMLRGRCLHTLAAELQNGNEALLIAYGEMLMTKERTRA